jgi:hypothetical protein
VFALAVLSLSRHGAGTAVVAAASTATATATVIRDLHNTLLEGTIPASSCPAIQNLATCDLSGTVVDCPFPLACEAELSGAPCNYGTCFDRCEAEVNPLGTLPVQGCEGTSTADFYFPDCNLLACNFDYYQNTDCGGGFDL